MMFPARSEHSIPFNSPGVRTGSIERYSMYGQLPGEAMPDHGTHHSRTGKSWDFLKNSISRSLLIRPQESAGLVNTRKRDFGDVLKKLWFYFFDSGPHFWKILVRSWGGERFGTKVELRSAGGSQAGSRLRNHEILEKDRVWAPKCTLRYPGDPRNLINRKSGNFYIEAVPQIFFQLRKNIFWWTKKNSGKTQIFSEKKNSTPKCPKSDFEIFGREFFFVRKNPIFARFFLIFFLVRKKYFFDAGKNWGIASM